MIVETPCELCDGVIDPAAAATARLDRGGDNPRTRSAWRRRRSCHGDWRQVAAWILADVERRDRLQARNQNHETDDQGENRPAYKEIGETFHGNAVNCRLASGRFLIWARVCYRQRRSSHCVT